MNVRCFASTTSGMSGSACFHSSRKRPYHWRARGVADPVVHLGRAFEVGEHDRDIPHADLFVGADQLRAEQVAEGLCRQQTLARKK